MANLAKLYAAQQKSDVDGMVAGAVDKAMKRIVGGIDSTISEQWAREDKEDIDRILATVSEVIPALSRMIGEAIQGAVHSIVSELGKIEPLDEIKGMVKGIRIPDHTGHLAALERAISSISIPETDLKPVLQMMVEKFSALDEKLDEILEKLGEDKVFTVVRDEITKLMDKVVMTSAEEEAE